MVQEKEEEEVEMKEDSWSLPPPRSDASVPDVNPSVRDVSKCSRFTDWPRVEEPWSDHPDLGILWLLEYEPPGVSVSSLIGTAADTAAPTSGPVPPPVRKVAPVATTSGELPLPKHFDRSADVQSIDST